MTCIPDRGQGLRRAAWGAKPLPGAFGIESSPGTVGRGRKSSPQRATGNDYRLLFELNPSPICVLDAKTLRFLVVNKAAEKQCGWPRAELLRLTAGDICCAKELHRLRAALKAQRGSQLPHNGLWQHRRKDGSLLEAEVSARAIEFSGRPAHLVLITGTARHREAEEALRESQERLHLAQSAARIGTFDWDILKGKVLWSPETERIWGLRRGEFKQTYAHWRKLVHPEDLARAEALARRAVRDPKAPYVAARVGVSCHTICNIELGYSAPFRSSKKRGMYIKPYIEKLCNVLGFEFADLFPREVCNIWKSNLSDDQIVMITVGEYHRKNQIDRMMIAYLRIGVSKVLNTLSDKEAMAIELVYGLNGNGNMTLQSIGEAIGVSKERVRQIIAKALRKLRHPYRRKIIDEDNIFESSSAYRMKGYDPCELLE